MRTSRPQRAHELGLVNAAGRARSALDAAIALAEKITANGPLAVAATKRIIVESRGWSPEEMWTKQTQDPGAGVHVQRRREGAVAFAEKRQPNWTGS